MKVYVLWLCGAPVNKKFSILPKASLHLTKGRAFPFGGASIRTLHGALPYGIVLRSFHVGDLIRYEKRRILYLCALFDFCRVFRRGARG